MSAFLCSAAILILLPLSLVSNAQTTELPKKIRGYKVHSETLKITNEPAAEGKPYVVVGRPNVSNISISGVTLAVSAELRSAGYEGRVDRVSFRDFTVNGLAVEVRDLESPFDIEKTGTTVLPGPATIFLPASKVLRGAWSEVTNSKNEWTVNGLILVFGKFKKFGFSFKRVVPVDVQLRIKNPFAGH
jgi:hypothetical protein